MTHTCLACGFTGDDVRMTVVEVPKDEQRVVDVPLVSATDRRGRPLGMDYVAVRELYASEPRCRDKAACAARVKAMQPAKPAPADERDEGGPSWMRS